MISMHGLGMLAIAILPLSWPMRLLLMLVLVFSLIHWWRGRNPVKALHLSTDGKCSVRLGNEQWVPAEVLGSSFVQPWLAVLHLKLEGRRHMLPLILLPDMLKHDEFRRLRVWLLWGWRDEQEL